MILEPILVEADVEVPDQYAEIEADLGAEIVIGNVPEYDGDTEATPSNIEQVFMTEGKKLLSNFKVNPIPSNYGLITWNGAFLTVS